MNFELLEKILNLFDNCQSRGKSLEINIDEDLVQILPFPRKLILDCLSDPSIANFFRLSNDQNTLYFQNNLRLCSIDQNEGGSCHSVLCQQLHICENYLLKKNCSEFQYSGKCSHSHSLSTNHNENILKKYHLSSKDEQTFQFISRLIQLSTSSFNSSKLIVQSIHGENISDRLIDQWLDQHKSLLKNQRLINSKTIEFIFDDDEVASMMEDYLIQHHSKTALVKKDIQSTNGHANHSFLNKTTIERPSFGRGRGRQQVLDIPPLNNQSTPSTFSRRLAASVPINEKKFTFSQRLNSTQNRSPELPNNGTNSESSDSFSSYFLPQAERKQTNSPSFDDNREMTSPPNLNTKSRFVLREQPTQNKEKSPIQTLTIYNYNKPFMDEHLCYLLGPGQRHIKENDSCEIVSCLPSGYCRLKNIEQGKDIEKHLYSLLPNSLNIELLKIDNDLSLIVCSPAAEDIFQQSQMDYAIVSEPEKIQVYIEVIHGPSSERKQYENTQQSSSSDDKFYINTTNSSIDIISGDITQTPVDMMICISTSNNLCENVLRRAGPSIESEYKARSPLKDALLLDGGLTAAQKILFVPWQTEIEETETTKTEKSLSDLVKWCLHQAHKRNLKSISFPPIGAGQLGLDPFFVCETMITAARECLDQYQMNVLFVIYPSNEMTDEDECYQIFRIYLDSLRDQPKVSNESKISKNLEMKNESIRRDVQSKRILILSDSSKIIKDHHSLIKSLEDLMHQMTFDLSLIESSFIDQIDLLIDTCLNYHVYPRMDYSRKELILRGDRDSCFQCFFNLRQGKKVYQYNYNDEKIINPYISLKIDEAFAVGESNICVKDDDQRILNIDLNQLQLRVNKDKQTTMLVRKQLNMDRKIPIPSLLMIRTIEIKKSVFQSLDCFQVFQKTMPISDWQISRIESIENYPLYLHFMNKYPKEKRKLYFHGCPYSSVQSIIHYGLHDDNSSIYLTREALDGHLHGSRRSTDGKYYLFAVDIAKNEINDDLISLSNEETDFTLPTYLIVYQRRKN